MDKHDGMKKLRQDRETLLNRPKTHKMFSPEVDEYKAVVEEGNRWGTYGKGALGSEGYFEPGGADSFASLVSFEAACENISKIKGNKKAMVIDVMGTGKAGVELGADISIGWTYQDHREEGRASNQIVRPGDLFEKDVARNHLADIDTQIAQQDTVLAAVIFRAVGGYAIYKENLYANAFLYEKYLRPLYERAPIGMHFYLNIKYEESYGQHLLKMLADQGYRLLRGDPNERASLFCAVLIKTNDKESLPDARSFLRDLEIVQEK